MSDFWKKRRPQLTDDEERALWERVRTMPREVAGGAARRRSPWSRPAVRFGAPVLAVALVAIVWVVQQSPEAPRRKLPAATVGTTETQTPTLEKAAPSPADVAPMRESAPEPAPAVGGDARMAKDAPAIVTDEMLSPASPASPAEPRAEGGSRARVAQSQDAKEATGFAAPPAAAPAAPSPAQVGRKDEAGRVSAEASAPQPLVAGSAEAERNTAGLQGMRVGPDPEALLASRVRAVRGGDFTSLVFEDVVRPESGGPFRMVSTRPTRGGRFTVTRDADGRWRILTDPSQTQGALAPPRLMQSRTGLAVELVEAIEAEDRSAIERVRQAAQRLRAENPDDPGTRELEGWCGAAKSAIGGD